MDISRSNYEDFFLLYVDGELTPEECDAVEAFAALHPDLQEELDLLLTTRLNAEPVVFGDKSSLMADSMKTTAIDDSLLSYIDDELHGEEKAGVEWELERNADLRAQHALLLKTKLDPTEKIVYPHKEELYRRSERGIRPMFWLRAASVVILLGWGAFWYMDNYGTEQPNSDMAMRNTPAVTKPATPAPAPNTPAPQPEVAESEEKTPATETPTDNYTPAPEQSAAVAHLDRSTPSRADYKEPEQKNVVIPSEVATNTTVLAEPARVETIASTPQQNINTPAVTLPNTTAYNSIEVPTGEDARGSVAREDNDKKGSMRGFLRKTTRFIERRTGINPTNEGDELMIGAMTISLK